VPHAVACSSGTASVPSVCAALDPEPGDEFITTPITDMGIADAHSVAELCSGFCGSRSADVGRSTRRRGAKISPRTRAIIAVHLAGQPCDRWGAPALANDHGLVLIEDCSQAYWANTNGKLVGTIGDLACFSLQQTKHMTCGEAASW